MEYKNITIRLLIRVLLIFLMLVLLAWILTNASQNNLYVTTFFVCIIIGLQVWELIYWLQKTNRVLIRFLEALEQGDFMARFDTSSSGSTQKLLLSEMNRFLDSQATRNKEFGFRIGFLEILIEHLPNGIICWGENDKVVFQNPAAIELLGIGSISTWAEFLDSNPDIRNMLANTNDLQSIVYTSPRPGKNRLLKIDVWPFTILGENTRVMTIENITSELEEKEAESWQELLRVLSHEIRNSITPVSSLTETISSILKNAQDSDSDTELSEQNVKDIIKAIDIIQQRSVRLRVFTENVLKVTRIPTPEIEGIVIQDFMEGIISFMKGDFDKERIDIELKNTSNRKSINVDPIQLDLIITNLLTNSIHSLTGNDNARIIIAVSELKDMHRIMIEDNGKGIPKENLEKIFMPFFTTKANGHGLGLSIVRQMVNLHGGTIYCESEPGEWTRFVIELPIV